MGHPTQIIESNTTHGEFLGIVDDTQHYRKRDISTKDVDVINRHLADAREASEFGKRADETEITVDNIALGVDNKHHDSIRKMLRKHEEMWTGELGTIHVTEHNIDLIPDARPFKSAPYRAGPKTRELVKSEVDKQLAAGVIEP